MNDFWDQILNRIRSEPGLMWRDSYENLYEDSCVCIRKLVRLVRSIESDVIAGLLTSLQESLLESLLEFSGELTGEYTGEFTSLPVSLLESRLKGRLVNLLASDRRTKWGSMSSYGSPDLMLEKAVRRLFSEEQVQNCVLHNVYLTCFHSTRKRHLLIIYFCK